MSINIRIVSTWPPRRCGIGTFSRDLSNALENFTGEIGHIRIAAIDKGSGPYHIPVDIVINQYDPKSWINATNEIVHRVHRGKNPTAVLLQHEYGLDPDDDGSDCKGNNYVKMAKRFKKEGIITLVYLHTVLDRPNDHQRDTIIELAKNSDGLIVTTESAIDILESKVYRIEHEKIKHIDHGIRMEHPSQFDRLAIKKKYGLDKVCLVTTLGLLSPDKGVQYGIRGYGSFVNESCTSDQRKSLLYLIAGQCHPEFVKAEGGKYYREYVKEMKTSLDKSNVKHSTVSSLDQADIVNNDIIFLDAFLDEQILVNLYAATNVMLLPYLNMQQMSSGILADTLGSGRVAVATKFRYALELIHSNKPCGKGLVIGRHARGILVDPGEDSVLQIAEALDYLVFNMEKRLKMEGQSHQRGHQMRWDNSAWALIQHVEFLNEHKETVTGRGINFIRMKKSAYQRKSKRLAQEEF